MEMKINKDNWKMSDINVDSLWIIPERDKSGKHANVYHGNFIPQIPNQLIRRYTEENDVVLDMFMGSGTTLYECEKLNRKFIGFDINQTIIDYVRTQMKDSNAIYEINNCDITNSDLVEQCIESNKQTINFDGMIDFFISHPPYLDIIRFTELDEDLSHISEIPVFLEKFTTAIGNVYRKLKENKYFAVVIGDVYRKSEVVPLSFYVMYAIKKKFNVKLKGTIIKNIEGNKGKLGLQNIWKYRALKSDYYLFKHEYIFVFKKIK